MRVQFIPEQEELMTDADLCEALEISYATLYNHLRNGPPSKRYDSLPDVRDIEYVVQGGRRKWLKSSVNKFLHG